MLHITLFKPNVMLLLCCKVLHVSCRSTLKQFARRLVVCHRKVIFKCKMCVSEKKSLAKKTQVDIFTEKRAVNTSITAARRKACYDRP